MTRLLILLGKCISRISSFFHLGAGGTWPGEIVLFLSPHILKSLSLQPKEGIILVAGTNGKTTTSLMISHILKENGKSVVLNDSGANLFNGVVSALIQQASWGGEIRADFGVFEIDENSLPLVLSYIKPRVIVFNNLFRDQLDRYGEIDTIAQKWREVLTKLPRETTVILNSDDPQIAYLGKKSACNVIYFGIADKKYAIKEKEHATDSIFCLFCGGRLRYAHIYYSHLGDWYCSQCSEKRPKPTVTHGLPPLPGTYNVYNTLAAVSVGKVLGISDTHIQRALATFSPAFGRQEEFVIKEKKVKLFLSKNPVGFNESLKTILQLGGRRILLVLNDRIPDGTDISWIWDVDFEMIPKDIAIVVSGDRVFDLAIRLYYAQSKEPNSNRAIVQPDLREAIRIGLESIHTDETLYILPTYSAMLEVRKILTGRKIL